MTERIDFKVENHIAHIQMTRGDKMNALDDAMMDGLIEAPRGSRMIPTFALRCCRETGAPFAPVST